jgi:hypothetical protein
METQLKLLLIVMLLSFGFLSCGVTQPSNITGTWVLRNESRERFLPSAQKQAAAKIVLDANGTFAAIEIPEDLLYGGPQAGLGLVTGKGSWKLQSREGKEQVQLNFEAIAENPSVKVPYGTQLNVSQGSGELSLFYFQGGDADQGRKIEFERK